MLIDQYYDYYYVCFNSCLFFSLSIDRNIMFVTIKREKDQY